MINKEYRSVIKALLKADRTDLVKKVISKIRLFYTPLEQKDVLVEQLKEAEVPMSDTALDTMVTELITMKTPSYNAVVSFLVDKYRLPEPTASLVVDIVNRAMGLREDI